MGCERRPFHTTSCVQHVCAHQHVLVSLTKLLSEPHLLRNSSSSSRRCRGVDYTQALLKRWPLSRFLGGGRV